MAKVFQLGDWRSGYYRDQTFMFAAGIFTVYQFFSQLYAHPDVEADPSSGGRQMNSHFATRMLTPEGRWVDQTLMKNSASDISTTGGQMPRLLGFGLASKLYRNNPELAGFSQFSNSGNEVAFCTVGNASTSEGVFLEAVNAAGVRQIPTVISIWDDGYGISVPNEIQTTKADISEVLKGFQRDENGEGFEIFKVKGWDYPGLCETYERAATISREQHIPVLIHVTEMTQPLGHSSSGSHERYKSQERLAWEKEFDCIAQMRAWMIESSIAEESELAEIERSVKEHVRAEQRRAWADYNRALKKDVTEATALLAAIPDETVQTLLNELKSITEPSLKEVYSTVRRAIRLLRNEQHEKKKALLSWYEQKRQVNHDRYNSHLFTDTVESPKHIPVVRPDYGADSKTVDGREVLNACFDANFARDPKLVAFGEDVGKIGDVNQGF